jgi:hypothetical protein
VATKALIAAPKPLTVSVERLRLVNKL